MIAININNTILSLYKQSIEFYHSQNKSRLEMKNKEANRPKSRTINHQTNKPGSLQKIVNTSKHSISYFDAIKNSDPTQNRKDKKGTYQKNYQILQKQETEAPIKKFTLNDALSRTTTNFGKMNEICHQSIRNERKKLSQNKTIKNIKLDGIEHPFVQTQSLNPYKKLVTKLSPLTAKMKKEVDFQVRKLSTNLKPVSELIEFNQNDPIQGRQVCKRIMNEKITPEQKQKHELIIEKLKGQTSSSATLPKVILALKQSYQSQGSKVIVTDKSNFRSRLSLHILSTKMFDNVEIFQEEITDKRWDYEDISYNAEHCLDFIEYFKEKITEQTKIPSNSIFIHEITGQPFAVKWETNCGITTDETETRKKLHKHQYFQYFELCLDDFDSAGDMTYGPDPQLDFRGNWPYYLPVRAKRFGLRVRTEYDEGNDDWLKMNGNPYEWAVAFHGVKNISKNVDQNHVLHLIIKGRKEGNMLKPGYGQAYRNNQCINKPDQKISAGIYVTPHLQEALSYTNSVKINDQGYRLVFQCRAKPQSIQVIESCQTYWVVQNRYDLRPYGIILIKEEDYSKIKSTQIPKGSFKYENFKARIQKSKK